MRRYFWAFYPEEEVRVKVWDKACQVLNAANISNIKPVLNTNTHMTLCYIGELSDEELEKESKLCEKFNLFESYNPLTLKLDTWCLVARKKMLALAPSSVPDEWLDWVNEFRLQVRNRLPKSKVYQGSKAYLPHVTIGGSIGRGSFKSEFNDFLEPIYFPATHISLMYSDTSTPGGKYGVVGQV